MSELNPAYSQSSYSDEELELLYSLGIFYLEAGHFRAAESIFSGLTSVAPSYFDGWLAYAVTAFISGDLSLARRSVQQSLRLNPHHVQAQLMNITVLISMHEFNDAGSMLGEVQEQIEQKLIINPEYIRYYKAQMARFEVAARSLSSTS